MGEKCKPSYRNLNTIQSYSEQKYATVQWCEQNCQNDEWLKQQVEQLKYLTPPAVRKSWNIVEFIDFKKSYGCASTSPNTVGFKAGENGHTYYIDFKPDDEIKIDTSYNGNTCEPESYQKINNNVLDSEGNPTSTTETRYRLPSTPEVSVPKTSSDVVLQQAKYRHFGTGTEKTKHNSAWYIGFNKAKNYYVRPDWIKNWKDKEIPSVCRAQTFKVPKGYGGTLVQVDLGLEWNGSQVSDCGSPLYVQIWKTYDKYVTVRNWNKEKKVMEYEYIKYDKIKDSLKSSGPKYENKQKYEKYEKKLKYTEGKHKGEYIKYTKGKNKGKIKTETLYRKKDNGDYVRKREKVEWLGHNQYSSSQKKWLNDRYHPLTEQVYDKVGDTFPSIVFDTPVKIEEGETYAIVLFSPLSEWKHCPRWAGWGRNCKKDNKYSDGYAFMSEDNGKTWVRYGKNGIDTETLEDGTVKNLVYKKGKYTPQDFLFNCKVRTQDKKVQEGTTTYEVTPETYESGEHYLYLEPIYSNPITNVKIEAYGEGLDQSVNDGRHIEFDISTDGDYWIPIEPSTSHGVSLADDPSRVLLVRARMWHDDEINITPYLDNFKVIVDTLPSKEFYARSVPYTPKSTPMLGANVWGRLYAPFSYQATVNANVEIIEGKTVTDHFKIISLDDLNEDIVRDFELDETVLNYTGREKAEYLTSNSNILETLKQNFVYVKPTVYDDKKYLLSFSVSYNREDMVITGEADNTNEDGTTTTIDETTNETISSVYYDFTHNVGGLRFSREVAYPILHVSKQDPKVNDTLNVVDTYKEWIDYTFDYEKNELIFKQSTLDNLTEGDLHINYNPIFISRLTRDDVGRRVDIENNTVEEGLILDYFKETIPITSDNVETRRVGLRVLPTDPIREVRLYKKNRSHDDEYQELYENWDYTLDSKNNELEFNISNGVDGVSSILSEGDTLTVVYTPFLEDSTLYVGYYATREDTSMQCSLENMYWEYKA